MSHLKNNLIPDLVMGDVEEDILVGFVESDEEVTTGVVVAVFVKDE